MANINEIIEETNQGLSTTTDKLSDISSQLGDLSADAQKFNSSLNVEASVNRLVNLEGQMSALDEQYKQGRISADSYTSSLSKLESEADSLSDALIAQGEDVDALTASVRQAKADTESLTSSIKDSASNVGQYETSFEKMGATANTSLGLIAAAVKDVNPGLSTMIGSFQKLIPNLQELGVAAKKTGSLMKAMTSGAGILTLITLVTTLVTDFDNIAETIGISTDAITTFKTTCGDVIQKVSGWLGGLGNTIYQSITAPIQGAINAFSILKEKGLKGGKEAAQAIADGYKEAWSFKKNFQDGQNAADTWVQGIRDRKKKSTEDVAKEVKDVLGDAILDAYKQVYNELADMDFLNIEGLDDDINTLKSTLDKMVNDSEKSLNTWSDFYQEFWTRNQSETDKKLAALDKQYEAYVAAGVSEVDAFTWVTEQKSKVLAEAAVKDKEIRDKEAEDIKQKHDERVQSILDMASTFSKQFSTISDAIESNLEVELKAGNITEKDYEKRKKALKKFSIASIVADTAAAIAATWYTYMKSPGGIPGAVLATAQSLALGITAGVGIKNVNNETLGNNSAVSTPSTTSVQSPQVSTPAPSVQQTYVMNQDSYADVLDSINKSVQDRQVVLVVDDVTRVQETQSRVATQSSF